MNPMVLESDYDHPVNSTHHLIEHQPHSAPFYLQLASALLCISTKRGSCYLCLQMLQFPRSKRSKQSKSRLSIETTRDVPKGIDQLSLNSFSMSMKSISYNTK